MSFEQAITENQELRKTVGVLAELEENFFETEPYKAFRRRLYAVMEARDKRLKIGLLEQKGGALIGPSGAGKSRMVEKAIADSDTISSASSSLGGQPPRKRRRKFSGPWVTPLRTRGTKIIFSIGSRTF